MHIFNPDPKTGVTAQELANFVQDKWLPECSKLFPDLKGYLTKSIRGQDSSSFGIIFFAKTEAHRNQYWTADGKFTPSVQKAVDEMLERLGKENEKNVAALDASNKYSDWILQ